MKKKVEPFEFHYTHSDLILAGVRWLRSKNYNPVLSGIASCAEIPDVIAWKSTSSCVIECKTSKSDFRADRKKYHRFQHAKHHWILSKKSKKDEESLLSEGYIPVEIPRMGSNRYYLSEPGIVTLEMVKEDAPDHGLLHIVNKKVKCVLQAPFRSELVDYSSEVRYLRFALVHLSGNLGKRGVRCDLLKATLFFGDDGIAIMPYARTLI